MNRIFVLIIIWFLFISTHLPHKEEVRDFHIKQVGIEEVIHFEQKFPMIINDRAVYIAYLQKYYRNNEDEFMNLIIK